ncbi:MAG: DUF1566 domain-containing protein [Bacteroidales bacterium]|nr:DUF1566 domain-containing protein [Bacteroidales bacterium]
MKKYLLTFVMALMVFVMPCQAQNQKLKLAVYATGNVDGLLKNIAQNNASTELVNGGRYQIIERSTEFLRIVSTEHDYQRSGAVDDGQIADLGKQYGADCVCVVDITHIDKYMYVATRMIDVVAAISQRAGDAENTNYMSPADLRKCVTDAVKKMEGKSSGNTQNVSYNNGNNTNASKLVNNIINGHEYVDLGLSVKWATCNVGAETPEAYGNHYAWGETTTKSEYTKENCQTNGLSISQLQSQGYIDSEGKLTAQYDAATANWGGDWRMPTYDELKELEDNCTWTWTTQNGVKGYKVTSMTNGNSIFLPAAGFRNGSSLIAGSDCFYWSSTPYKGNSSRAYILHFHSSYHGVSDFSRGRGRSARPVLE